MILTVNYIQFTNERLVENRKENNGKENGRQKVHQN